jgi:hypothetical protein
MKLETVVVCLALTCACTVGSTSALPDSPKEALPAANQRALATPPSDGLFAPTAFQATPGTSSQCDAVLLPQVTIQTATKQQRIAWLSLITRENYAAAHAGGGINIILFDLPIGASYDQFSEAREKYFKQEQLNYSLDEARSVLRQTLSPEQVTAWTKCITQDAVGVRVAFTKDTPARAVATVYYTGTPDTRVRIRGDVTGGKFNGRDSRVTFLLPHGGSKAFTIARESPTADLIVVVNSDSMSDSAISFHAIEATTPPPPRCINPVLLSRGAPVTASASQGIAARVTDGSTNGGWNSGAHAPQWVDISLPSPSIIHHLKMVVEQSPPGYTEHRITGTRSSGPAIVLGDLNTATVSGGEYVVLVGDGVGVGVQRVRVESVKSPSWIAWREIEVWGCKGTTPVR